MSNRCKLLIDAPREIPVLRGAIRERTGAPRPQCLSDQTHRRRKEILWSQSKAQALAALRRQLDHIFPPAPKGELAE